MYKRPDAEPLPADDRPKRQLHLPRLLRRETGPSAG
jgi:hypothetical protein